MKLYQTVYVPDREAFAVGWYAGRGPSGVVVVVEQETRVVLPSRVRESLPLGYCPMCGQAAHAGMCS